MHRARVDNWAVEAKVVPVLQEVRNAVFGGVVAKAYPQQLIVSRWQTVATVVGVDHARTIDKDLDIRGSDSHIEAAPYVGYNLLAERFHIDARHLVRGSLQVDDVHAKHLALRPQAKHAGRQAYRAILVEETPDDRSARSGSD